MPTRLHQENINTPAYFDNMWKHSDWHKFDTVRMKALCEHIDKDSIICELGAGLFGFAEYAANQKLCSDISVVDFSEVALNRIKDKYPNIITYKCDISSSYQIDKLLKQGTYDLVGAGELIEHMENPRALAFEMALLCKLGGWLVISSVNPDCADAKKHEYPEHLWKFTPEELVSYFEPYGKTTHRFVGNYHLVECKSQ